MANQGNRTDAKENGQFRAVHSILVSQPEPKVENSPYFRLAEKFNIKIDFRPFIEVKAVTAKEFRKQKVDVLAHTAIIFTES